MPSYAILIPVVALCCLPLCVLILLLRIRKSLRTLGPVREHFCGKIRLQFIGVLLASPVLIILLFFRSYDPLTSFAIAGTGVIGFYIACQDLLFSRFCGIYSKGILWNGTWVIFDELKLWKRIGPYSLILEISERERRILQFPNSDLVSRVETCLLEILPPEVDDLS